MLVEGVDVEVGERARPGDPVDVGGTQPRVGDRPLRGLGADLPGGAPGRLRVRGLADARNRYLRANGVELRRVTPLGIVVGRRVGHVCGTYQPPDSAGTGWATSTTPRGVASSRRTIATCSATRV